MRFETGQHIISYGFGMTGAVIISVVASPDYGIGGYILLFIGIAILGFGGILEGSIKE